MQDDVVAIPGYTAFRLLGRGGFSAVYQARQEAYDRSVAVKVIDIGVDDEAPGAGSGASARRPGGSPATRTS